MRRLIWLPIAGFLLVAGAAIAAAAAAPSVTPVAQVNQDAASPAPTSATTPWTNDDQNGNPGGPPYGHAWGLGKDIAGAGADMLDQVLSDLVKAGTITQAQSDAITNALQQAITDKQNQAQQQRQQAMQEWQQIQGFLSDGVITQDEVNQLPADSPFRQLFDSIAKNGQVTLDQLQQLRMFVPGMGPGMAGPGGHGPFGPGGPWGNGNPNGNGNGNAPQASPNATGSSS